MRVLFIAWITFALLLFGLGTITSAGDELAMAGFVSASDQEAREGYFAIGGDAMMVVKPDSGIHRWLQAHSGQRVRVVLEPDAP